MKTISLKIFILPFLILYFFSCKAQLWNKIIVNKPKQSVTIAGFSNEKHGITAGYAGASFFTDDSAKTWQQGNNSSMCRFGLEIIDDKIAFHCGNAGQNRVTIDGGKTWKKMKDFGAGEPGHCRYLSFIDENIGWIAAPDRLASTSDCGNTWNKIVLPDDIGSITAIELLNDLLGNTGFIMDSNGFLYVTNNGGLDWSKKQIKVEGHEFDFIPAKAPKNAMHFNSSLNGIIIVYQTKPEKEWVSLTTKNGGNSWEIEQVDNKIKQNSTVFISNDGKYLTFSTSGNEILVFKKNELN